MLEVTFFRDSRDRLSSVSAEGHAGWADYGQDVVCAASSAVLQAARLGLESHVGLPLHAEQHEGSLKLSWPESSRDDLRVAAIVATAELAIEQIARQYPGHVRAIRRTGA